MSIPSRTPHPTGIPGAPHPEAPALTRSSARTRPSGQRPPSHPSAQAPQRHRTPGVTQPPPPSPPRPSAHPAPALRSQRKAPQSRSHSRSPAVHAHMCTYTRTHVHIHTCTRTYMHIHVPRHTRAPARPQGDAPGPRPSLPAGLRLCGRCSGRRVPVRPCASFRPRSVRLKVI